ncbi:hypothetical protein WCQ02_33440 [Paraburkholderia tropica]|uniref:hypothetical protein n=1 Tax=Paraburkholderia tropica TaxID=92647 RepID=UPI003017A3C3
MSAKPRRMRPAANVSKGTVPRQHLKHGSVVAREDEHAGAIGLTKVASTLSGGASAGLAAAVLLPSLPILAGIATIAGLIGSGLLVKRYG